MPIFRLKSYRITSFVIFLFFVIFTQIARATFFGEVKTGLQNVAEDRYGYSVYVPTDYSPEKSWPLVIALHDEGQRGEDYIQAWTEHAQKRGVIILCPTFEFPRSGLPYDHDKRLIELKKTIQNQYEIDSARILITGFQAGGHYAVYLGLRYPKEFTASASVGNGLKGIFQKLFTLSYADAYKLPILILLKSEDLKDPETSAQLNDMSQKGYQLEVVETENQKDFESSNTNFYVLDWFAQMSAGREGIKKRNVKQTFYEWVDGLLQNQ